MESEGREPNPGDNSGDDGREAIITTFREITSATREEAIFFLEYHQFDLDAAVSSILDEVVTTTAAIYNNNNNNNNNANDGNENVHDNTGDVLGHSPPSGPESPEYHPSPSRSRSPSPSSSRGPYELRSRRENKLKKKKRGRKDDGPSHGRRSTRNNVRTLSDLKRRARDDSSSDDSDEPPEYYTGGEKSGMLVQDRTRGSETDAIFRRAKQVAIDPADHDGRSSRSKSFTGTARLLSGETVSASPVPPEVVTHTITFWRNGFSVDDGPLRRFDDPENASFMESIKESECPEELEPADSRTSVHVDLERRDENYPESRKPLKQNVPFQGVGRTIGSSSSSNPDVTEPAAPTSLNAASLPSMGLVVDESSPSTSIQLRLADGTRMITRFNHHHTIRDIRDFIDASRPGGSGTYQLLRMGFPPKQLADLDQTIEQAGVANSVVIQKF